MKPLILLDQDGVLADFDGGFYRAWKQTYPDEVVVELSERTEFRITRNYPPHLYKAVQAIYTVPGFFRHLAPLPGAIDAAHEMLAMGFDVRICTSPLDAYENCVLEKYQWIEQHLGREFVQRMVVSKDKTLVHGDVLIDDNPQVIGSCAPSWKHIVFDQPYNRQATGARMGWGNWREALQGYL